MTVYKITANGVTQTTSTGLGLYTAILDKFDVEYKIEKEND